MLYILLLIPGVAATLAALSAYRPLDTRAVMGAMLGLFLLAPALQILSFFRKQPNQNPAWLRAAYVISSCALILLGVLLFLNGRLDRASWDTVRTTVVRKTVLRGRRATQYDVAIASWRPGKGTEIFNVSLREFNQASVGKTVIVPVHKGFFHLPWFGNISPE